MSNEAVQLKHVMGILRDRSLLPKKMDVSKIGSRYWISSYDTMASQIVSESIFTGMSNSKEIAVLKSLSEKVERAVVIDGARKRRPSCETESSDGFACIPRIHQNAVERVRENALNEAIERFTWATWWDDKSIAFQRRNLIADFKNLRNYGTMVEMMAEGEFESPHCIVPMTTFDNKIVIILFAPLKSRGFVSGGACGNVEDVEETIMRGLDELFRHAIGFKKMNEENLSPITFYERRLAYFGSGLGDHLVKERLTANGSRSVSLPSLLIDEEVPHDLDHDFLVHRCLFKDQPPFIGGDLARLCL